MDYNIVKVFSKGQMTIPQSIRKKLDIKKNDPLVVYVLDDELRIKKVFFKEKPLDENDPIWKMAGMIYDDSNVAANHDKYLVMEKEGPQESKKDETSE